MDKILAEYTVKWRALRWPLPFFYNIIDINGLASYIIYDSGQKVFQRSCQSTMYAYYWGSKY